MPTRRPTDDCDYPLLTATGTPPLTGSCGRPAAGFPNRQEQQAVFDGEIDNPALLAVARSVCAACPVRAACQRFADDSLDDTTFLAGKTAAERARARRRSTLTLRRKTVVGRMREAGVTVPEIVFYTGFSKRSVESDRRARGSLRLTAFPPSAT